MLILLTFHYTDALWEICGNHGSFPLCVINSFNLAKTLLWLLSVSSPTNLSNPTDHFTLVWLLVDYILVVFGNRAVANFPVKNLKVCTWVHLSGYETPAHESGWEHIPRKPIPSGRSVDIPRIGNLFQKFIWLLNPFYCYMIAWMNFLLTLSDKST